jgi:FSR family fosmidomycin resistance protein-like MFS transporter
MSRYVPLICLALTHTIVDTCALLIAPLWPELNRSFSFSMAGLSIAFVVQSIPTSVSQAVFGFFRDRNPAPQWLWLGPVFGAVFLTAIGLTSSKLVLFALLIVGGIGVGAFHPEAAVTAGRLIPDQRTRSLSVFMFGGALGLALGPTLSGFVVSNWGLDGLIYLAAPLVGLIFVLRRIGGLAHVATNVAQSSEPRRSLGAMFEGRGWFALSILAICSLRLVPNMAMDKVLAFMLEERGFDEAGIGRVQSLFLISASVAMLVMVFRFRSGWERRFMILCPLAGIPLLAIIGWEGCPHWLLLTLLVPTGCILWGTTPAMVSYAQHQFPRGAGVASAITMGLAWGIAGLIQAPITAYFQMTAVPQHALLACIPALLLAGLGAYFLPESHQIDEKQADDQAAVDSRVIPAEA